MRFNVFSSSEMRSILLFLSILQTALCSCPYGFELVQNECRGNYTRIATNSDEAATLAIAKCQGILGQPIIIHNSEQQTYWSSHVGTDYTAIGLVCNCTSKKWEWADGSGLDYKPPNYATALNSADCTTVFNGVMSWIMRKPDGTWGYNGPNYAMTEDIFCTAPLRQPIPSADGCESFADDDEDGVCYQVGAPAENWQEAQMICGSFGSQVASIHNEKENSFLRRLAVSRGAVSGMYLGATIAGKGSEFGWLDGSDWDYNNFYAGFPKNGLGECLVMDTEGTKGLWSNADCSSKLSVACMRDHNYTTPACTDGPWKEGQIIFSPGFPYDSTTPCDYLLEVEAGKKVGVVVHFLEANPCCDSLTLVENYFGGSIIANLTGQLTDQTFVTSSSNFMRVSWQPNYGQNVRGMMMTFRGV